MASSFWKSRPVFVTGASGCMGGWLVRSLVERQAEVVVLLRDSNPRSMLVRDGLLGRVTAVYGNLEDFGLLRRSLAEYAPRTVFHLAAQPLVGVAKIDPLSTLRANVEGTWNVLEAARLARSGQVVAASSDKAYGATPDLPYRETHPLEGRYPYDVSKSCADLIASMYAVTFGLPVAVLRCANLFGGGDLNFSRTIPGAIRATLAGERFRIRSDGRFVRDFLYAKDAAEAYLLVAEALEGRPELSGEAFNFSVEAQLTVLDVAARVLRLMGREDLEPVIENQASAEIREQYLDCSKARQLLAWKPRYGMDEALRETIDWYAAHFGFPAAADASGGFAAVDGPLRQGPAAPPA
jgi:CDP-glucose 4,6-dehydratase